MGWGANIHPLQEISYLAYFVNFGVESFPPKHLGKILLHSISYI